MGRVEDHFVQAEVRTVDNVARFGGEEFVVLLRETGLGSAFLLAERLRRRISGGAIEARGKKIVSATASSKSGARRHRSRRMRRSHADLAPYRWWRLDRWRRCALWHR